MSLRRLVQLCALALVLAPVSSADSDKRFEDRVGTLPLDQKLDARGNLGGVTIDRLGFVYVANFRDALWRISPEGEVVTLTRSLYGSSGNAVDAQGRIYQANFNGNSITRIERSGEVSTFVAGAGLNGPVGIAISPKDGTLYVCNCSGNEVVRISTSGEVSPFAKSELFACPNGIAWGGDERLYVSNFNNHEIVALSPDGEVEKFATVPGGAGNAHLVYAKGFFYVTKIIAQRIVKVSASGEVFPVAGTGQPGHADGPGSEASFMAPNGITLDPRTQRLYVNTMVGEYSQPQPSRLTIRTIDLVTLSSVLGEALESGGLDAARAAYAAYKADPVRGQENTSAEMITFAYGFLSKRQTAEAFALFQLNAESYPDDPNAHFHLGEAYRYTGQTEKAAAAYRRVQELEPEGQRAPGRLQLIGAE